MIYHLHMESFDPWLERLHTILDSNEERINISNQDIAEQMGISERQLFRKIKKLTSRPPRQYVRSYQLQRAMQYLENGKYSTVNEAAFAVGYHNVGYFIKQFEEEFDKKPFQVLQESGWR